MPLKIVFLKKKKSIVIATTKILEKTVLRISAIDLVLY